MNRSLLLGIIILLVLGGVGYGLMQNRANPATNLEGDAAAAEDLDTSSTPQPSSDGSTATASPETVQVAVAIRDFEYSPATLTVKKGTTVVWTNSDVMSHTVTGDTEKTINSPLFGRNQTYRYTFNETGTFTYHCEPHPSMRGTVVVTE